MPNPFIEKARQGMRQRQRELAQHNYNELLRLLRRYTDEDNQESRERIRLRTEEARKVLEDFPPSRDADTTNTSVATT